MYKTIKLSAVEAEQIAIKIHQLGDVKGTSRMFNFALNDNFDSLKDLIQKVQKSLIEKPKEIIDYEKKLKDISMEYSAFPKDRYQHSNVELSHIHNVDGFNKEANRLISEYKEHLDDWEPFAKDNSSFWDNEKFEVRLFFVSVDDVPELTPKQEYWIGKFIDYSSFIDGKPKPKKETVDV